ncbi:hypothetical protein ABPG72_006487 [Tetrahymena utriculariae]
MNHSCQKVFEGFVSVLYDTSYFFRNFGPFKAGIHYATYANYLAQNWAPRVSYIETNTAAYTLAKNKYAVYIVYGIIGGALVHNYILDNKAAQKSQQYYLKHRD